MTRQRQQTRPPVGRPPWPIAILAWLAVGLVAVPMFALVVQLEWRRIIDVLTDRDVVRALVLSLATSAIAAIMAGVLGLPLAWLLAGATPRFRRIGRAVVSLSMVTPPVVAGVALFAAFGRRGLIGSGLNAWFGITIPFTTFAVVLAQTFVAMPFFVLTVEAALASVDPIPHDAARTLGAGAWYRFSRVTMPMVRPALAAGLGLAWARALGEFGATITFAGNLPGVTQTMPLATYLELVNDPAVAVILSVVLLLISLVVLIALRGSWTDGVRGSVGER